MVLDTNTYLHAPERFDVLNLDAWLGPRGQRHLLVLMVNLDELDVQKRGNAKKEIKQRARETLRVIEDTITNPGSVVQLRRDESGLFSAEVVLDDRGHVRLNRADDELVDRARAIAELSAKPVSFITGMSASSFGRAAPT